MIKSAAANRGLVVRWLSLSLVTLSFVLGALGVHNAWAGEATEEMRGTIEEVLRIIQDQELKQPKRFEERRKLLEKVVGERFDYREMSFRTLSISQGDPWKNLTEKEREEFVELFQTLLVNLYAGKIESYSGEGVKYINERVEDDYAEVRTKVLTGKTDIPLYYRLKKKPAGWRVYDVVFEESTSLVKNYQDQFKSILRTKTFSELLDQLRVKTAKLKSP